MLTATGADVIKVFRRSLERVFSTLTAIRSFRESSGIQSSTISQSRRKHCAARNPA
jgi:hypothetical protein